MRKLIAPIAVFLAGCPRPIPSHPQAPPRDQPAPLPQVTSRARLHTSIAPAAIEKQMDERLTKGGALADEEVAHRLRFRLAWTRGAPQVALAGGRMTVKLPITVEYGAQLEAHPLGALLRPLADWLQQKRSFTVDVTASAAPSLDASYRLRFDDVTVRVDEERRDRDPLPPAARAIINELFARARERLRDTMQPIVVAVVIDFYRLLDGYARAIAEPFDVTIPTPRGPIAACVGLRVDRFQIGKPVIEGRLEQDVGADLRSSLSLGKCPPPPPAPSTPGPLPPIELVEAIEPSSHVAVPVGARWDDLSSLLRQLHPEPFAVDEQPRLKLSDISVYSSTDAQGRPEVVAQLAMNGVVSSGPLRFDVDDGMLYLIGEPRLDGLKIKVPSLEVTSDTGQLLVDVGIRGREEQIVREVRPLIEYDLGDLVEKFRAWFARGREIGGFGCIRGKVEGAALDGVRFLPGWFVATPSIDGVVEGRAPCD